MPVVIIGGGISGLSAAWQLAKTGNEEITLVEPGHLGGLLRTERIPAGGSDSDACCVVECGADSWIRSKPWLRELASEAGLADQIIACNEARRGTFILRNGTLLPLPKGLRLFAPTEWRPILESKLVGWRTKARMLGEVFRRPVHLPDRSIFAFVRDHFGEEALEYLAEPLFAGVYGGTPETLGADGVVPKMVEYEQKYGSLIRGAKREPPTRGSLFESMQKGLGQIPEALVAQLLNRVRFIRSDATAVESGRVQIDGEWLSASRIILACGAPAAAKLLHAFEAGHLLDKIRHSSATIFVFGFSAGESHIAPRGFGFLVPRRERKTILGATWVTNKFTNRAPEGTIIVRCFVSGLSSQTRIPEVLNDLKRIIHFTGEPKFARVHQWPDSLPQYEVGHRSLVNRIQKVLPKTVELAGAFLNGVGMPDCVRSGKRAAGISRTLTD